MVVVVGIYSFFEDRKRRSRNNYQWRYGGHHNIFLWFKIRGAVVSGQTHLPFSTACCYQVRDFQAWYYYYY